MIRFQPSEFMKIIMPATIAWYLAKRTLPPHLKHVAISLVMIGVPFILIVRQPDLGTALLILASGAFVLFMGGLKWRWIISVVAAAVPVAVAMWFFVMHDYQKQRVLTFLDPESDPLGTGWNIIQSKAAIDRAVCSARAGCWARSRTWTSFRKAIRTSLSPSWVRSSGW